MATRYRDLQGPSVLQTRLVDTSRVSTAQQLADTFKTFERTAAQIGTTLQSRRGQEEGAAAGAIGQPGLQAGWRALTAYGEAYNDAAKRSYAIRAEQELEVTAARIEVDAANNPEKFKALMGGALKGVLEKAPEGTQSVLNDIWNARIAKGVSRLSAAEAEEIREQHRAIAYEGLSQMVERMGQGIASDDPEERALAELEQEKAMLVIRGAQDDGTFTAVEAAVAEKNMLRAVTQQVVVGRFRKELDSPYGDPAGFILNLKKLNRTEEALSPEEEAKLEDALLAELREHNALLSAQEQADIDEDGARFAAGEKLATEMLLSGTLTRRELLRMVQNEDLDPSVARVLQNELESNVGGNPSDPRALFHAETNLLSIPEEDLARNSALSWKDRADLILKRRELSGTWRSTQQAREGADRIDRALGLVPGMLLERMTPEQTQQRDQALTDWYDRVDALPEDQRRVKAIEEAENVANLYIRKKASERVTQLRAAWRAYIEDVGPPEDMNEVQRKAYDQKIRNFEKGIADEEAKAR